MINYKLDPWWPAEGSETRGNEYTSLCDLLRSLKTRGRTKKQGKEILSTIYFDGQQ